MISVGFEIFHNKIFLIFRIIIRLKQERIIILQETSEKNEKEEYRESAGVNHENN